MKIGKLIFRSFTAISASLFLVIACGCTDKNIAAVNTESGKSLKKQFTVTSDLQIENSSFTLSADKEGAFSLLDKSTGVVYYSNPDIDKSGENIKGISRMQMKSQLIVEYIAGGKNAKTATSYASAVNKGGLNISVSESGILAEYSFKDEKFFVPVLYTLNKYGVKAEVLNEKISENGDNEITSISLLPYFAAAGLEDEGYFLVPDGSGALIDFNNGKSGSYQQKIYNTNGLMNVKTSKTKTENALLPVFGRYCNGNSMLAVIDGGASSSMLYGFTSAEDGYYNRVYPKFTYREASVVSMLSKTWYPVDITYISPIENKEDFSVLYCPLQKQYGGYSDMAAFYRNYLSENTGFGNGKAENETVLNIDFYGSALTESNFCGFPVTVNTPLTSFEEAKEICNNLKSAGAGDIRIRYRGITKSGLSNKSVPKAFKPSSSLGGKGGFNALADYANKNGIQIYPDADFIYFKNATYSLISKSDAVRDVAKNTGFFYKYNKSNGAAQTDKYFYALKPDMVLRAVTSYIESYKKQENPYVSLSTLGSFVYTDFSSDTRLAGDTEKIFKTALKLFKNENITVMTDAPNAYALPYTSVVFSAPSGSSCFDIENKSVPFYQMILHGAVAYTNEPVNMSYDSQSAILKAIETGSGLLYSLSNADYSVIKNDGYDELYCITASDWLEDMTLNSKKVKEALEKTSGQKIVYHGEEIKNVFCTRYENGTEVFVNYNDYAVELKGIKIEPSDCYVKGADKQ